ncbi:MAG: hypothetical protein ACRC10_02965 [Thermoguttaceae bacterium]
MIPVQQQQEPDGFDRDVRQRGLAWLQQHGIDPASPPPESVQLKEYWQSYNRKLWDAYDGVCAYYACFLPYALGASSTDHFIPKSQNAGLAYEWTNYRLACLNANRRKNRFCDVLDPFTMLAETFYLVIPTGEIYVNPAMYESQRETAQLAEQTIERLRLNDPDLIEMRLLDIDEYCDGFQRQSLQKRNPFVYFEMARQGMLK